MKTEKTVKYLEVVNPADWQAAGFEVAHWGNARKCARVIPDARLTPPKWGEFGTAHGTLTPTQSGYVQTITLFAPRGSRCLDKG
jgi:hypothetical protein